jgi:ligand-binding SRPBCC domain-containing protein
MEQTFTNNSLPLWIGLFLYLFTMIYKDILKPFSDRRTAQLLEIEKENKLIKKYNADKAWQEKVIDILTSKEKTRLSLESLRSFVINAFTVSGIYLLDEIRSVFERNEIKNPVRQSQIKQQLLSFLQYEKDRVRAVFEGIYFQDVKVSDFFNSINNEHTQNFINQITETLFDDSDVKKKQSDLNNLIDYHYKAHVNDCLSFVKTNQTKTYEI